MWQMLHLFWGKMVSFAGSVLDMELLVLYLCRQ